jgi:hypothetical protein
MVDRAAVPVVYRGLQWLPGNWSASLWLPPWEMVRVTAAVSLSSDMPW